MFSPPITTLESPQQPLQPADCGEEPENPAETHLLRFLSAIAGLLQAHNQRLLKRPIPVVRGAFAPS